MKRNEILGEQKKGVKAVKYNKKPKDHTAEFGKAKEKLAPQKPLEEGAVKELTMDLKSMTDEEFQSRYKMSKAEARANLKKKDEGVAEGYRDRRDAYQRDYDSSVSGMGKRQSLAYQLDGGANDEGEQDEPTQRPQRSKGMYFYNVPAGKENEARIYGLKQTKSGKWYSKVHSAMMDKVYGPGRYWEPKTEAMGAEVGKITKVDPATKKATLTKPDGSSMEVDSTALKPTPDGKMQMDTPDATDLKTGTSVVSTENSVITELDPPPNDSTSPITGNNNHDEISKLLVHRLKRLAGLQ